MMNDRAHFARIIDGMEQAKTLRAGVELGYEDVLELLGYIRDLEEHLALDVIERPGEPITQRELDRRLRELRKAVVDMRSNAELMAAIAGMRGGK